MPTERLSMRRIRQILQLHFGAQASARVIARELGVGRSTVQGYLARAASAELGWPLPVDLTDQMLEERLFPPASLKLGVRRYIEPDWAALVREMKRPGVNLMILWEEYQAAHPEGYGYSRFCELYRGFERMSQDLLRVFALAIELPETWFVDKIGRHFSIMSSHHYPPLQEQPRPGQLRTGAHTDFGA